MSVIKFFKQIHLTHFSKPVGERAIWKVVTKHGPSRIVELGIGDGVRTTRMLNLAAKSTDEKIQYTGQDLFEGRPSDRPGMRLKDAHRAFSSDQVSSRLAPGDVRSVLMRMANSLTNTDLLLISNDHDAEALEAAWYYVPRMLGEHAIILRQEDGEEGAYTVMDRSQVDELAEAASRPARAAA